MALVFVFKSKPLVSKSKAVIQNCVYEFFAMNSLFLFIICSSGFLEIAEIVPNVHKIWIFLLKNFEPFLFFCVFLK